MPFANADDRRAYQRTRYALKTGHNLRSEAISPVQSRNFSPASVPEKQIIPEFAPAGRPRQLATAISWIQNHKGTITQAIVPFLGGLALGFFGSRIAEVQIGPRITELLQARPRRAQEMPRDSLQDLLDMGQGYIDRIGPGL